MFLCPFKLHLCIGLFELKSLTLMNWYLLVIKLHWMTIDLININDDQSNTKILIDNWLLDQYVICSSFFFPIKRKYN
jgi:hypothetical protein